MENKLSQSNKGFTLVEICVTMVIFSILATITTMSLLSWQEYSTYTKQQESAEILYMSARNKIAELRADDALSSFLSRYYNDNRYRTDRKFFKEKVYDETTQEYDYVYYAYCWPEDYAKYVENRESYRTDKNNKNKSGVAFLFELLEDHLYDKSLLKNNITIAFFENGNIYAVYFSEKTNMGQGGNLFKDIFNEEKLYDNRIGAYVTQ